jgi:hypothetical protein
MQLPTINSDVAPHSVRHLCSCTSRHNSLLTQLRARRAKYKHFNVDPAGPPPTVRRVPARALGNMKP